MYVSHIPGILTKSWTDQFLKPKRIEGSGSRIGLPAITRSKKFTDQDFIKAMPKLQISAKAYQSFRAEYDGFIPATPEQQTRMIKKHGFLLIIKCVSVLTIKLTSLNVGAYASDRD